MDPYIDKNKPEKRMPEHRQLRIYQKGSIEHTLDYPSLGPPVHLRRFFRLLSGRNGFTH
ncbi:MAG: hypothetical protein ABIG30_01575 [Candidatus Aenigmatarchaeota archaeon]